MCTNVCRIEGIGTESDLIHRCWVRSLKEMGALPGYCKIHVILLIARDTGSAVNKIPTLKALETKDMLFLLTYIAVELMVDQASVEHLVT